MMSMLKLQEYSHHEYEQIGVSSLVTRITSDAFVLMQFADKRLSGCYHTHDDAIKYSHDFLDESFTSLDCRFSVPFLAVVVLYVAVKTRPLSENNRKHWTR